MKKLLSVVLFAVVALSAQAVQLSLTWDDNSTDETGFKVEVSTDNATFTQVATVPANTTTYTYVNNTDQKYYFRVRAYNIDGNSNYTNVATYIPDIKAPTNLKVVVKPN